MMSLSDIVIINRIITVMAKNKQISLAEHLVKARAVKAALEAKMTREQRAEFNRPGRKAALEAKKAEAK
jgi:hypothetical protein